ncbi:MAG: hypothetical protein IKM65_05635 [Bacteroidaceae bacterium]|nr:hypothetical protein [Bacteroidaceae bacterium]
MAKKYEKEYTGYFYLRDTDFLPVPIEYYSRYPYERIDIEHLKRFKNLFPDRAQAEQRCREIRELLGLEAPSFVAHTP